MVSKKYHKNLVTDFFLATKKILIKQKTKTERKKNETI